MTNRKAYLKQYYIINIERIKKQREEYYLDNYEKIMERRKQYYLDNQKYIKQYSREYRFLNPEKISRRRGKNRIKNREKINERNKNWYKTEEGIACRQRSNFKRRTRRKEIINTLTSQEWLDILEKYNYRCAYCDTEFDCENLPTKDHVIPISKGGHNTKENIAPACQSCNNKKYNKILRIEKVAYI